MKFKVGDFVGFRHRSAYPKIYRRGTIISIAKNIAIVNCSGDHIKVAIEKLKSL